MNKKLLSLLFLAVPIVTFAQSTSDKIDVVFKDYTGWFVDAIFYEIPFSETFQIPWVLIVLVGGSICIYISIFYT